MADGQLFLGTQPLQTVFCGKQEISEMYLGTQRIFSAEPLLSSGTMDDGLFWKLTEGGVLHLIGNGEMLYSFGMTYPWKSYAQYLEEVRIGEGVQSLTAQAFYNYEQLRAITVADSVTSLGSGVVNNCTALKRVDFGSGIRTLPSMTFNNTTAVNTLILRHNGVVSFSIEDENQLGAMFPEEGCCVYVPGEQVGAYGEIWDWQQFTQIRAIEDYPDICARA